jgi:beta-glucosidase
MSVSVDRLLDGRAFSKEKARQILKHGIGEITRIGGSVLGFSPGEVARIANQVQRFLVEKTRLGIPAIIHEECLAGLLLQQQLSLKP